MKGLEGGLVGAVGTWLAWNTLGLSAAAFAAGGFWGIAGGVVLAAAGLGIFVNSIMSGMMQIYDWGSWTGWAAFFVDYSWGLVGTALGGMVQYINLFYGPGARYREDLSRRQNRHVYEGGFGFSGFAFTQGNVISNLGSHADPRLLDHEGLHILQSRIFGPWFQFTYAYWLVVGGYMALWLFGPIAAAKGENYWDAIMDVAYYDNPWEAWAYTKNPKPGGHGGMLSYAS